MTRSDRSSRRGPTRAQLAALAPALALLLGLSWSPVAAAQPPQPRESPRWGSPYRVGIVADVSIGVALCQPGLIFRGRCGAQVPGVGLRLGGGWRFGPHWQLSGAWVRQAHRPGGAFVSGTHDGAVLAVRGIVPLARPDGRDTRLDLGFELGLGWSQRRLVVDGAPSQLQSSGLLVRPALILDGWILADYALGLEIAPHINLHWRYCIDADCEARPGDWVPAPFDGRWVDGLTVSLRLSGLMFPRW